MRERMDSRVSRAHEHVSRLQTQADHRQPNTGFKASSSEHRPTSHNEARQI